MDTKIIMAENANAVYKSGGGAHTAIFCNATKSLMKKYMSALSKEGFKKYTEVSFDGSKSGNKNSFATYQSDDFIISIGYHKNMKRMYVTYTPKKEGWVLPPLEKPSYVPCGLPTTITQLGTERFHPASVSMCYVIRAADGSFIVYDSDFGEGMAELIYDVLKKQAPDPENIIISAWIFSHPHTDHVCGFIDFAKNYANDKTITTKQIVYNFSEDTYVGSNVENLMKETAKAAEKFEGATLIRPHAGDVLYYADLTFRVLYTQEEYLYITEGKIEDSNGASVVTQMETENGIKVLIGGDHCVNGTYEGRPFCEGALYKWYGDFIKSDMVTMFHHGFGGGADLEVYHYIKPSIFFWPATIFRLEHDSDGSEYSFGSVRNRPRNQYFTDPVQAKKNGVRGYYISADGIQIADLSDKKLKVTEYKTCDKYLGK